MKKTEENASTRFLITLPKEVHRQIKLRSAFRNITMRMYVLHAILERMKTDAKYE